jgi:hypothetical protein
VYVRRVSVNQLVPGVGLAAAQPVAASLQFEARSSITYDPQNRLWIAYILFAFVLRASRLLAAGYSDSRAKPRPEPRLWLYLLDRLNALSRTPE